MSDTSLSPLQAKLLEMLTWFDRFCRENALRYYCLGGTMLGAARHKGFIPWDDDIDVGMPRKDYTQLQQIFASKNTNPRYLLETPQSQADDFYYPISKLYDTSTTLIEQKRVPVKRGIFIDIFPLDGIGNSEQEAHTNYSSIIKRYNSFLLFATVPKKGRSTFKNVAITAANLVPQKFINIRQKRIKLDKLCSQYGFDKCSVSGNLLGAWRKKEIMPTWIMGKPTEYPFENIQVFGAEHYNEYLTHLYGNWMQLPPKDKQVSHHDFILLDLNKSFLEE